MADVWREAEDGAIEYVPTEDGAFERWMDEHDPGWRHSNSTEITFLRELWQAAREREAD